MTQPGDIQKRTFYVFTYPKTEFGMAVALDHPDPAKMDWREVRRLYYEGFVPEHRLHYPIAIFKAHFEQELVAFLKDQGYTLTFPTQLDGR